jgi:hypothetical protein
LRAFAFAFLLHRKSTFRVFSLRCSSEETFSTNNSLYFRSVLNRLLNEQVIQNHCNNKTFQKQITFQHKLALKTNSFRLSISLKRNESLMTGTKAIFQQFSHFFFGSIKDSSVFMALERNLEAVVPLKEEDLVREP